MSVLFVTGTGTEVGKTIVTAAVAACAASVGLKVAVVKPAEAGVAPGEESDVDTVRRLAAPATARTLASYPDPMSPAASSRISGLPLLELDDVVAAVRADAAEHDLVLVEGAGGLLVPMGKGWTMADLAVELKAPAVVVARAGLGTLNHTALTAEALDRRGIRWCLVFGAWPPVPELVHLSNFVELASALAGVVPDGAAGIEPGVFRRSASGWFAPLLHGSVDDVREWVAEVH